MKRKRSKARRLRSVRNSHHDIEGQALLGSWCLSCCDIDCVLFDPCDLTALDEQPPGARQTFTPRVEVCYERETGIVAAICVSRQSSDNCDIRQPIADSQKEEMSNAAH